MTEISLLPGWALSASNLEPLADALVERLPGVGCGLCELPPLQLSSLEDDLQALAAALPDGPLIGWSLGGVAGGILATLALCGPPLVLAYGMARLWLAWGEQWWFKLLQRGLAPVTIGLVCASAWLLTDAAASGWQSYVITAVAAVIIGTTRTHPIFILAAAGGLGIAGFA